MVVRGSHALVIAGAFACIALDGVQAHARMSVPGPNADGGFYMNSPAGLIDGPTTLPSSGYDYNQGEKKNYDTFMKAFEASEYKTLKDLVDKPGNNKPESGATAECGFSKAEGKPQALPDKVEWEGFSGSPSHLGPCEVWCDDEIAFHDDNCVANFADGKLPYDKTKCAGKKRLRSIWLALHVGQWQVYPYCATLEGGGSGGGGGDGDKKEPEPAAATAAPEPAATTAAPEPAATKAPVAPELAPAETPEPAPAPVPAAKKEPAPKVPVLVPGPKTAKRKKSCKVKKNAMRKRAALRVQEEIVRR